jgi:hypothetical protein
MIKGLFALFVVSSCIACGAKEDYSGDNELAKSVASGTQPPANASGKGVAGHAALMVPQQKHP